MAYEGNKLAFGNMNAELQEMIEQGGLYENIVPLEATNAPADYPLGESFFANTSPNIASWQTALGVDTSFTRLFVITRIDKDRLHALQDIIVASGTETKRFTRYNLNENWLAARESGGSSNGSKEYGTFSLGASHAVRTFEPFDGWVNNINQEVLQFLFPANFKSGYIKVKYSGDRASTGSNTTPMAEASWFAQRGNDGTNAVYVSEWSILRSNLMFTKEFYVGTGMVAVEDTGWKPYFSLIKKSTRRPIAVEIELFTYDGNAAELLEGVTLNLVSSYTEPFSSRPQQSTLETIRSAATKSYGGGSYYVNSTTGNDQTGEVGSTAFKFQTIAGVISQLPNILNHSIAIYLDEGTHSVGASFNGITGSGTISIIGSNASNVTDSKKYKLNFLHFLSCTIRIDVRGIEFIGNSTNILLQRTNYVFVNYCAFSNVSTTTAISADTSYMIVNNSEFMGRNNVLLSNFFANVIFAGNTGSNNNVVLFAGNGATIVKGGTLPTGTTAESTVSGGIIRSY